MLPAPVQKASSVASHTCALDSTIQQSLITFSYLFAKRKAALLFFAGCFFYTGLFAQQDSFDLVKFTPLKGWKKDVRENLQSYSITDNKTGGWCQISIVKSTISKGSIEKDFESEWAELIVKPYDVKEAPETNEVQEADGWKIKAGGGKFVFNNANAITLLTTMSGFDRCVSIVANTNSQDYLSSIQTFLESVDLKKPAMNTQQSNNSSNTSILGTWGANASENSSYRVKNGVMNYISRQYTFNANGTYRFISKAFDPLMDNILLGKENGTYTISGNHISISPQKSVLEAWSKKDGRDEWGNRLNSQNIPPEKQSYQFTKHYFDGNKQWSLVLQADKATKRDGPFSGNSTFTNAWYYGPISANNKVIELPGGQKIEQEEMKEEPVSHDAGSVNNGYKFNTTNFDDGWISTEKQDWVEVTKASIKVLIHYPNKNADAYNSVLKDEDYNAWNVLVAPRYSNMSNFEWKSIQSWQSISFMQGDATENATGKMVHIVLFKQHYSNGSGAYLEFVTNSKADYENEFGPYHNASYDWDKTANMQWRNKFAVAAADFTGKWTSDFTGIQQYVNVYTGADAGMNSYSSSQVFEFGPGNKYNWQITVASGMVGNIKFQNVKSSGNFSMLSNWQLKFSDLEGKPKTYDAYFSCARGARVLWLSDTGYPGYTAFGKKQ
ncbi:MAG: hypothetical protein IPP72_09820 [Chitinophagaceae bacterium]|nr:hypothetical protein [Chitinophagaceae bacterium]